MSHPKPGSVTGEVQTALNTHDGLDSESSPVTASVQTQGESPVLSELRVRLYNQGFGSDLSKRSAG